MYKNEGEVLIREGTFPAEEMRSQKKQYQYIRFCNSLCFSYTCGF